jgi:hypothetical protein
VKASELRRQRLLNLQIASSHCRNAAEVVAHLGAMQAQDFAGALWAIGLRLGDARLTDVEQALAARTIVRTWPMRGTLHFVAASDVVWMLDLLAPRVIAASARRHRELDLDAVMFRKVEKVCVRQLEGGRQLTRAGLREALARAKLALEGPRLYHCIAQLAQQKVLCCGVPEGKQMTFTLLREWAPQAKPLEREAALSALALRYFSSHGPATIPDLMRWAGINTAEATLGIAGAKAKLTSEQSDGVRYLMGADGLKPTAATRGTFLLPGFDEYMLGYKDRSAFLADAHASKIVPGGNGVFRPTLVCDGQVIGTWKALSTKREVRISVSAFEAFSTRQRASMLRAVAHYGRFLDRTAVLS